MIPVNFEEANDILRAENPEVLPLPVEIIPGRSGQINTCWELSKEEVERI